MKQKDRVFSYASMVLRDHAEAQDVAQEALVRLWKHRTRVDAPGAHLWLKRTAHNLCIDRLRQRKSRPVVGTEVLETTSPDPAPGPRQLAEAGELGEQLGRALAALKPKDQAVLVLREVQGLPYGEIAEILNMPLGTLKARLHRARELLRAKLIRAGVTP